ncbi:MAG: GTPase domain-containing protein [Candidatus Krumholzibacteria bacterium]|nr:GTPase domain-containing protein [Candidatus Krumholzibacteria bacterium]
MAVYNYAGGEVNIKIVYYGPGLSGKTTNLELMYSKLPQDSKGKMVSMKTRTDRTLFFDFLPIEVGGLNGMTVRFLLYTVPGQVYYNATRKLVLRGVDAVVFVADSDPARMEDNKESLANLEENLNELGLSLSDLPWVIQYNKRDLSDCVDRETMDRELNTAKTDSYEAVAMTGEGVYETFEGIAKNVFATLKEDMRNSSGKVDKQEAISREEIRVEVVAQGKKRTNDSETDKSESLGYAEEREEEHESVSEFVDSALNEGVIEESIDLRSNTEGYEEYGHVVELEDGKESAEEPGDSVSEKDPVSTVSVAVEEEKIDIINDPLDRLPDTAVQTEVVSSDMSDRNEENLFEKIVKVPVELTEEDIRNKTPLKVILDIHVTS